MTAYGDNGGWISLTLKSLKFHDILSDLKIAKGPPFTITWSLAFPQFAL